MVRKPVLYVLCFPKLTPATSERIESFRRRHEPERAAQVDAHVTLVFGVAGIDVESLTARARALAADLHAFDVGFDRAHLHEDPHRQDYHLFLMAGTGADRLTRLHRALYADDLTAELRPDAPFSAHLTIASAADVAGLDAARRDLSRLPLPIAGRIDALQVMQLKAGGLHPLARLPLQP